MYLTGVVAHGLQTDTEGHFSILIICQKTECIKVQLDSLPFKQGILVSFTNRGSP